MNQKPPLPRWIVLWLSIAAVVVTWDPLFVLNRPASMPGGALHFLWLPYARYIVVDHRYGDLRDPFVLAQSWVNLLEVGLGLVALRLHQLRRPSAVEAARAQPLCRAPAP